MVRAESEWIAVGAIARAHGVRGETKVVLYNRASDVLNRVRAIGLRAASSDGACDIRELVLARPGGAGWVIHLDGVGDRDAAERLRGLELCVRRGELGVAASDEFFVIDAIGAKVVHRDASGVETTIGSVRDVINYPSVDVLVVERAAGGAALEVPLLDAFVEEVDTEAGRVVLRTLEGLT